MSGKDNSRRRPSRRERQDWRSQNSQYASAKVDSWKRDNREPAPAKYDKSGIPHDQPRWTAPKLNCDPLPIPNCVRCGQAITDIHTALTDNKSGEPVHFDCVMAEMSKQEVLEEGDVLSYIGGGRFGVVRFANSGDREKRRAFTIKKIFEWENKDERAKWRGVVADHYSIT